MLSATNVFYYISCGFTSKYFTRIMWSLCYSISRLTVLLQVVFRSLSAQVFIFIQISSEMWDFDPNGNNMGKL